MANSTSPCTLTLSDGTHYDLSSLASASADYAAAVGDKKYLLNVCRNVVGELWNVDVDDPDTVGGYVSREGGDFSLGRANSSLQVSPSTSEPMLYLRNGSPCPTYPSQLASTAIRFICSPADFHAGTPRLVASLPPGDPENACHFFFEWSTHVACPTTPKVALERSHMIAFGAIVAVAVITWFGAHTLYNRLYLQRRGLDQFPIPRHLPAVPSLRRSADSANPSKPRWGFGRRSQRRGYTGIRADEDDEEEHFAARYSLDDEEEEDLTGVGNADARALGAEANAWRGGGGQGAGAPVGSAGLHQGIGI